MTYYKTSTTVTYEDTATATAMAGKGSFSFCLKNKRPHIEREINENLFLRIQRIDTSVARMYFVDAARNEIQIPPGITVFNNSTGTNVVPFTGTYAFALAWADSYTVTLDDTQIVRFANQRQWSLITAVCFTAVQDEDTVVHGFMRL